MHSYKKREAPVMSSARFERIFRLDPHVQSSEVAAFLELDPALQFEDLRELRRDAAHLSGGSFGALIAIYVGAAFVAYPLIVSGMAQTAGSPFGPIFAGMGVAGIGLILALNFALTQNNLGRSATRLAFYEQALEVQRSAQDRTKWRWRIGG